jgi:hypothetical protein
MWQEAHHEGDKLLGHRLFLLLLFFITTLLIASQHQHQQQQQGHKEKPRLHQETTHTSVNRHTSTSAMNANNRTNVWK